MKKVFHINIFILLFSICGFFSPVGARYYFVYPDKIELLQNVNSETFNNVEVKEYSTPLSNQDYFTRPILIDHNVRVLLKNRMITYRNIRATIESIFITSHQTNTLPRYIS